MKQQISQLAVFGGTPLFERPLTVGQPDTAARLDMLLRIQQVLESGWLTNNGPVVRHFEAEVCRITEVDHCVAVCNGTMALQVMAKACGLTGEVIVPAMTYIATAHALEWIGLKPVFADVDPTNHTLDAESVRQCITPQTSAILGVHLWGNPCDIDQLQQLADDHHLQLLFDASHAFGCRHHGQSIGSFGQAEAFSFHATKFVHSVEGGAILTQSAELAERMRLLRNFGITGLNTVESPGINGKLSEVSAAIGITSLESMAQRMQHNRTLQSTYRNQVADCPGITHLPITADNGGNGQYVVLLIDQTCFGLERDRVLQLLRAEGVFARSYFVPGCHRSVPYSDSHDDLQTPLPATESILGSILQCPVGPHVSVDSVARICELLKWAGSNAEAINERFRSGWPAASHSADPATPPVSLPLAG